MSASYRMAFRDWMACAVAGRHELAPIAATSLPGDGAVALAAAGHILDFDDTYGPGLAHISAPTAPAALVVGAAVGATIGRVLEAYAAGFEAMAALARAGHPTLYEGGWHPTAVTGAVGAAAAAASILDLSADQTSTAMRLAILGAGGLRAAFGSDGKSLQVGMAASQGIAAARMAHGGATAGSRIEVGYQAAYGAPWAVPGEDPAIADNWIKAYPCCLQTHSSIEAAAALGVQGADLAGSGVVSVHPRSRQAAPFDDVTTGMEAKFSIPYTVAYTILSGPPGVADFAKVDEAARALAGRITVRLDERLAQPEAIVEWRGAGGSLEARVEAAKGSPQRPMSDADLDAKVRALAGERLDGVLDDPTRPAAEVLEVVMGG